MRHQILVMSKFLAGSYATIGSGFSSPTSFTSDDFFFLHKQQWLPHGGSLLCQGGAHIGAQPAGLQLHYWIPWWHSRICHARSTRLH